MNKQLGLWLLLILSLLLSPRMATAQGRSMSANSLKALHLSTGKQSHHDLPGFDLANAQELMAQRLQELRELHQLQDQLQELLRDRDFLNNIKDHISDSDVQRLREKVLRGKGLSQDRSWEPFLHKASAWRKLDEQQIERLLGWAKRAEHKSPPRSDADSPQGGGPAVSSPSSIPPPGVPSPPPSLPPLTESEPDPTLLDRLKEESTKWLMDNIDDVGGNVLDAITQMDGGEELTPLMELLRSIRQPDFLDLSVNENSLFPTRQVGSLAHSLSDVGDYLHQPGGVWDEIRSFLRDASVPSLPRLSGLSMSVPSASAPDGDGWAPALLSMLMLGTIVVLLCKIGSGFKAIGSGESSEWRLGPWPVPPSGVSTRKDVIRTFEHLALLHFGPTAAACHHRTLAERLAEQDNDNPGRRQAAEMLAWLYEQARYAPAEDRLSPEQFSDARHALCLLAGVTAP